MSEHKCYGYNLLGKPDHIQRCPACRHVTRTGKCFPKYAKGVTSELISYFCPACSRPGEMPEEQRVLMECIEDQLTEGQKLLLRG